MDVTPPHSKWPALRRVAAVASLVALAGCGGSDTATAPSFQVVAAGVPLTFSPRLAAADDGTVWLAWTEAASGLASVAAARVDPTGAVRRLDPSAASADAKQVPRIVMAGDTPIVAWRQSGLGGEALRVVSWNGSRWLEETSPGPFVAGDFGLQEAGGGRVVLSWGELEPGGAGRRLVAVRSGNGAWSTPLAVPAPADPALLLDALDVAAADDGSVMAIWSEGPASPAMRTIRAARLDPVTAAWQPVATLDSGVGADPRVVSETGGNWLAFWTEGDPLLPRQLRAMRYAAGAWRGPSRRVDTAPGESVREAAAAPRAGDAPWLTWVAQTAAMPPAFVVRAARLDAPTDGWSSPVALAGPSASLATGLSMRSGADDRHAVVWGTATGPSGPFLSLTEGGSWRAAVALEEGGVFGNGPDLAALGEDGFAIAWYRATSPSHDVVLRRER